jgi:hypothetical protein
MNVQSASIRFPVEPRDVPPAKAARRLYLTEVQFDEKLPDLCKRGFPRADPTTGMYDLKAIDEWMDNRSCLTRPAGAQDSRTTFHERFARLAANA